MREHNTKSFAEQFRMYTSVVFDWSHPKNEQPNVLPGRIGHFVLVEEIHQEKRNREYNYGLYRDSLGKRALAKQLRYPQSTLAAYWLMNEIRVYETLWLVLETHPESERKFPHIHIPKLLDVRETAGQALFLLEYIEGSPLRESAEEYQGQVLSNVVEYLTWLGKGVATNQLFPLKRRTALQALLILPIIVIRSLWRFPQHGWLIIRASITYGALFPKLLKNETLRFAHRDLGLDNILVRNEEVWLIDFQIAALTHPLFDRVALLLKLWDTPTLFQRVALLEQGTNKNDKTAIRALAIYLALHNLSLRSGREEEGVIAFLGYYLAAPKSSTILSMRWQQLRSLWKKCKQQIYILMYSSSERVSIEPYNPEGRKIADGLLTEIRAMVPDLTVHLIGSVCMGIAGQRDIDIFIECPRQAFRIYRVLLSNIYGKPTREKREYLEWQFERDAWEVDVLLIDPTSEKFQDQTSVVWAIQKDPKLLSQYEQLKLSFNGAPFRDYERAKGAFLNHLRRALEDKAVQQKHSGI